MLMVYTFLKDAMPLTSKNTMTLFNFSAYTPQHRLPRDSLPTVCFSGEIVIFTLTAFCLWTAVFLSMSTAATGA